MYEKQNKVSSSRKACLESFKGLTDDEISEVLDYALKMKSKRNKTHVGEHYKKKGNTNN